MKVKPVTAGGSRVKVADFVPFSTALIAAVVLVLTPVDDTVNVPVVCP